jgi:hypothetical protein
MPCVHMYGSIHISIVYIHTIVGLKHQWKLLLDKVSNDRSISSLSQAYNYYIIIYKMPLLYNTSPEHGMILKSCYKSQLWYKRNASSNEDVSLLSRLMATNSIRIIKKQINRRSWWRINPPTKDVYKHISITATKLPFQFLLL